MISDRDKIELRKLLFSPQWKVIENVIEDMVQEIRGRTKVADSEWETVRKTLHDEGEERGVRQLQQRIFDLSQQAHD